MNQHYAPDLRTYGYAPGGYICRCTQAGCQTMEPLFQKQVGHFAGDKRAWRCQPCAIEARNYALSAHSTRAVRAPQLVRDKMMPREGVNEANTELSKPLAIVALIAKIHMELGEVVLDMGQPDEYADVLEALMSLAELNGVTEEQVRAARAAKNEAKGRLMRNFWTPDHFMENDTNG